MSAVAARRLEPEMDFSLPDDLLELQERTRRLVREEVIPYEADPRQTPHGPAPELRRELVALGRRAGLSSPHVGREWGGLGLDHRGKAVVFEEAGYSPLGPVALNCFAPDEANMHLLEQVADERQKERWLRPLAAGEIRSCFMMTEPAPGAGSDPSMLKTTARRAADGNRGEFVIDGAKWLITGAVGAEVAIIMAKNDNDESGPAGATMFLAPMDAPGIVIERVLDTLDQYMSGGHAVIRLDGLRVPESAVLGRVGEGFRYAQVRLAPARLTHCMRWLGAARRAHDIATDYARRRTAFGKPLGEHEGVGFMLADNEMDLHTSRLVIWHAAWLLDQGQRAGHESSMAKVICSEAIWRVVDRSVQVLGGLGITDDTIVARLFREVRPFRIYDGPSEVHRWSIARRVLRGGEAAHGTGSGRG
jgi:acyl-CoA dehydrogenase